MKSFAPNRKSFGATVTWFSISEVADLTLTHLVGEGKMSSGGILAGGYCATYCAEII
jgi:hypothetical protein